MWLNLAVAIELLQPLSDRTIGVLGTLFGAIGVIGVPASVYFYLKSRRAPRPQYQLVDEIMLNPSNTGFSIRFDGKVVDGTVRKVTLTLWNSGNLPVRGSDVSPVEPLGVALPNECRLLYSRVLATARRANNFQLKDYPTGTALSFDYLDEQDWGVVEVFYSSSEPGFASSATLKGAIQGIPEGFQTGGQLRSLIPWGAIVVAVLMLAPWIVLISATVPPRPSFADSWDNFMKGLPFVGGLFLSLYLAGRLIKFRFKSRLKEIPPSVRPRV